MGLFTKNSHKSSTSSHSTGTGTSRHSSSHAETSSLGQSSTSSLKSPTTPLYKGLPPPQIPKIDLPKAPDPLVDPAGYLRSIGAVREQCRVVGDAARSDRLAHFDVDMGRFKDTTSFVVGLIKVRCVAFPFWALSPFDIGEKRKGERRELTWADVI